MLSWKTCSVWLKSASSFVFDSVGAVPRETAVDRQARRRGRGEEVLNNGDDGRTNVAVVILQQVSVFSNWWACSEAKCTIGLAGRFVFSFASGREPGPPHSSQFGNDVVLPLVKSYFRLVLQHLGPQAPFLSNSPLLRWSADDAGKQAVYQFRLVCSDITRTLFTKETKEMKRSPRASTSLGIGWPALASGPVS